MKKCELTRAIFRNELKASAWGCYLINKTIGGNVSIVVEGKSIINFPYSNIAQNLPLSIVYTK